MKVLLRLQVPLPPLPEQRRIVDILNRANGIRRLRREAQEKARQIIPALFVEMFGDPQRNPKGWPVETVGELFQVKGGKRLPKGAAYSEVPTRYRYLRGTDIWPGHIDTSGLRFLPEDVQSKIRRYTVSAGDVVITIAGKIGVAAPIHQELDGVNLTENAAKLVPLRKLQPVFFSALMNSSFVQDQISGLTGRVTIGKLALYRIEQIKLLVPPLDLQQAFASGVSDIQAIIVQQNRMSNASERLVNSLMAEVFQ